MVWLVLRAEGGRLGSIDRFQHRGRQERESGKQERFAEAEECGNGKNRQPEGMSLAVGGL